MTPQGQAAPSATRLPECRGARLGYGWGSPLLSRANPSSLGPAEMLPLRPSARIASRHRVRGDRPSSMVLMISGHASRVDSNRARILLDGISLSAYPIASSMQISVFSPGLRARGLGKSSTVKKSISGMKNSSSGSSFVRMSFALRGAPCGDDSGHRARNGDYHDQQAANARPTDDPHPILKARVFSVVRPRRDRTVRYRLGLREVDVMLTEVRLRLVQVPVVVRHRGTVRTAPHPGLIR